MLTTYKVMHLHIYIHTLGRFNNHTMPHFTGFWPWNQYHRGDENVGNILPRAGIEPSSLAFWANVLTITPPYLSM